MPQTDKEIRTYNIGFEVGYRLNRQPDWSDLNFNTEATRLDEIGQAMLTVLGRKKFLRHYLHGWYDGLDNRTRLGPHINQ